MGVINMILSTIESMLLLHAHFTILFISRFIFKKCGEARKSEKSQLPAAARGFEEFFEFWERDKMNNFNNLKFKKTGRCGAVRTDDRSNV